MTRVVVGDSAVGIIREAIRNRRQLYFTANDHPREMCPHILGTKRGYWHVLGWQFGGSSSSGLPPEGEWRCFEIDDISTEIVVRDGEWHRGWTTGRQRTSCVDQIDTVVDAAHGALIRSTFR